MKKINGKYSFFFLVLVSLMTSSCTDKLTDNTGSTDRNYYFQYEYSNYAWGSNHSGFTVTPSGEVYKFNTTTSWVFAQNGKISSTDLLKNISLSIKADMLISKTEMQSYFALASIAKTGALSTPVSRGADMGAMVCKVFVPNDSDPQKVYDELILSQTGDSEMHNLKQEAAVLADWLTSLHLK